jgi:hypothetical protein
MRSVFSDIPKTREIDSKESGKFPEATEADDNHVHFLPEWSVFWFVLFCYVLKSGDRTLSKKLIPAVNGMSSFVEAKAVLKLDSDS